MGFENGGGNYESQETQRNKIPQIGEGQQKLAEISQSQNSEISQKAYEISQEMGKEQFDAQKASFDARMALIEEMKNGNQVEVGVA